MEPNRTTPKDAQVMASILKEMGVNEYEPRVINQMLDFSYSKYYDENDTDDDYADYDDDDE